MINKELNTIEDFYKTTFTNLKTFESVSESSGIPIGERVYESLSGDYYYGMIIPYKKEEIENNDWFKKI